MSTPAPQSPTTVDEHALVKELLSLCATVATLRTPVIGCPWDLAQDHRSLRPYMLEEAQEAAEAMGQDSPEDLCEELGDVLLQVVLNAHIAAERGEFSLREVIASIQQKLVRRHPHVFGSEEERQQRSIEQIGAKWQEIKAAERAAKAQRRNPG
jgi:MazG family protein